MSFERAMRSCTGWPSWVASTAVLTSLLSAGMLELERCDACEGEEGELEEMGLSLSLDTRLACSTQDSYPELGSTRTTRFSPAPARNRPTPRPPPLSLVSLEMANPSATSASRSQSGKFGKGERGTSRKDIPPPTGAFALPPPKPHYFEDGGLRKVKPYMCVPPSLLSSCIDARADSRHAAALAGSRSRAGPRSVGRGGP